MLGTHEDEEQRNSRQGRSPADGGGKAKGQGSWIYAPAHKTGSRQASRDYPSGPASQACHVSPTWSCGSIELKREGLDSILPQQASGSCHIILSTYVPLPPPSLTH